jgi:AraC family transcriptional regulator
VTSREPRPTIAPVNERRSIRLHEGPCLGVWDVLCSAERGEPGPIEHADVTQVIFPLGGVFQVHRGRDVVAADPSSVVVLEAGRDHRVGHPGTSGDRSVVLVFPPEITEDAFGSGGGFGGPVGARVHLAARALTTALRCNRISPFESEDLALGLLDQLCSDLGRAPGYRPQSQHQVDRVERVRTLLAIEPHRRWHLDDLAKAVHCSPYHLARQFRRITGTSVSGYLLRLRLVLASQRLADGADDLAAVAHDLGFASHSHFSARFRSVFGAPPTAVRHVLTAGGSKELSTLVTANDGVAP